MPKVVPADVIATSTKVSPGVTQEEFNSAMLSPEERNFLKLLPRDQLKRVLEEMINKLPTEVPVHVYSKLAKSHLPESDRAAKETNLTIAA